MPAYRHRQTRHIHTQTHKYTHTKTDKCDVIYTETHRKERSQSTVLSHIHRHTEKTDTQTTVPAYIHRHTQKTKPVVCTATHTQTHRKEDRQLYRHTYTGTETYTLTLKSERLTTVPPVHIGQYTVMTKRINLFTINTTTRSHSK